MCSCYSYGIDCIYASDTEACRTLSSSSCRYEINGFCLICLSKLLNYMFSCTSSKELPTSVASCWSAGRSKFLRPLLFNIFIGRVLFEFELSLCNTLLENVIIFAIMSNSQT